MYLGSATILGLLVSLQGISHPGTRAKQGLFVRQEMRSVHALWQKSRKAGVEHNWLAVCVFGTVFARRERQASSVGAVRGG